MIQSIITVSQLMDRIDAWYYQPIFLEVENLLKNEQPLEKYVSPVRLKKNPAKTPDIKFCYIEIDNIDIYTGEITPQELFGRDAPSRARKGVNAGDCIVSTVRPNRNAVGLITKDSMDCICSTGFSVLKPNSILSEYLFTFLKSRFGLAQLTRPIMAAMYPAISETDILKIRLPIFSTSFQMQVKNLIDLSIKKRRKAEDKYAEAERLVEKEYDIRDFKLVNKNTFKVFFNDAIRLDPEYYQPKYNAVKKILERYNNSVTLGEISLPPKYGTSEDLYYIEKGTPLLRVTDIDKFYTIDPLQGKFISYEDAGRLENYKVNEGDIIISRTGTLGSAVYIDNKLSGSIYGSYFIKVTPRHPKLNSRFVAFFLNSRLGKLQSERWASGGIQTNLTIEAIKSLNIPILPKSIQEEISSLLNDALTLRNESKNLIKEAKNEIEFLIEHGKSTKQ